MSILTYTYLHILLRKFGLCQQTNAENHWSFEYPEARRYAVKMSLLSMLQFPSSSIDLTVMFQ